MKDEEQKVTYKSMADLGREMRRRIDHRRHYEMLTAAIALMFVAAGIGMAMDWRKPAVQVLAELIGVSATTGELIHSAVVLAGAFVSLGWVSRRFWAAKRGDRAAEYVMREQLETANPGEVIAHVQKCFEAAYQEQFAAEVQKLRAQEEPPVTHITAGIAVTEITSLAAQLEALVPLLKRYEKQKMRTEEAIVRKQIKRVIRDYEAAIKEKCEIARADGHDDGHDGDKDKDK